MRSRRSVAGSAFSMIGVWMNGSARAANGPVTVTAQRVGMLGACQVGVMSVMSSPLEAVVVIAGETAGRSWEATEHVTERQSVLAGRAIFRVDAISPAGDLGPGSVSFTPAGLASAGLNAVTLVKGGMLRVDGPDVAEATDMRATAWGMETVDVELWPARSLRENLGAGEVTRLHLVKGDRFTAGQGEMVVIAIETAGADHPMRAVLQMVSRGR